MDRVYESAAAGAPPAVPVSPSAGYPSEGNPATGTPATKPGPYWYHQVTQEIWNVIDGAGIEHDHEDLTQLFQAISALIAASASPDSRLVGETVLFGGSAAPTGWLLCNGAAVSRTTYSALFAVVGETYGAGDGSTTFNLPDLRGRAPIGVGQGDTAEGGGTGTDRVLGAKGGKETHTLTQAELPAHQHGAGSLTAASAGDHTHTYQESSGAAGAGGGDGGGSKFSANTGSAGAHSHSISGATGSIGSGSSHDNVSPFLALNFIIKH